MDVLITLGLILVVIAIKVYTWMVVVTEIKRLEIQEKTRKALTSGLQINVPGKGWVSADKYKA